MFGILALVFCLRFPFHIFNYCIIYIYIFMYKFNLIGSLNSSCCLINGILNQPCRLCSTYVCIHIIETHCRTTTSTNGIAHSITTITTTYTLCTWRVSETCLNGAIIIIIIIILFYFRYVTGCEKTRYRKPLLNGRKKTGKCHALNEIFI